MSSQNSFANASLSSSNKVVGTSTTSASAVRSRPRRLVSFMDDEDDTIVNKASNHANHDTQPSTTGLSSTLSTLDIGTTRSRGATPSPLSSRGASPLPMKHPSRVTEPGLRGRNETTSLGWNGSSKASSSRATGDFLDSPWSSLQNLASSVLGSDIGRNSANNAAKTHTRRKPSRSDVYIRSIPRSSPLAWGPSAPNTPEVGTGTKEERQALVQAKKREALLLADCDPVMSRNSRHKRRDSGDYFDQQPIDPEQEEEALAYIHPVAATDSITGVTIKFGCQAAIFRKANGFWPNDNIQSRKTVLLPVDACTVKGRPIRPAENVDLLSNDNEDPSDSSITPAAVAASQPSTDSNPPDSSDTDRKEIWKHESWVQIDGFPSPIQIGRVSRRSLGFFPRTRRKSISFTDSEPPSNSSRDLTRTPSPAGSPQLAPSQGILPRIRATKDHSKPSGSHPARPNHRRQRSSIHLSGTGVGPLDCGTTAPGPAMDGLSKFFSQHMPYLAPPAPPTNQRRSSFGSESTATSNASGLENIGGALEGWVRKVAARTKAGINDLQQASPNQHVADRGRGTGLWGVGDLIEMDDASEGRRSPSLLGTRRPEQSSSSSSSFRAAAPSASATSRSRATGLGSGSGSSPYGERDRAKDD